MSVTSGPVDKRRLALIYIDPQGKEQKYTFRSLKNFSNQLANTLRAHGIERTDRVGILLSQRPETLISHIAVYKLGAVAVQLLTLFGPEAIEYRLERQPGQSGDYGQRKCIQDP